MLYKTYYWVIKSAVIIPTILPQVVELIAVQGGV